MSFDPRWKGLAPPPILRSQEPTTRSAIVRPKPTLPAYGRQALAMDVKRLRVAWKKYRKSRSRNGIYQFLGAIFEVASIWLADGRANGRTWRALSLRGCKIPGAYEPFRDLVVVAAHPVKIDRRTLAKWSRTMRYAAAYKRPGRPLGEFIAQRGGMNACASLYTRRLGRKSSG